MSYVFFSQKNPFAKLLGIMVHEKNVVGIWKGRSLHYSPRAITHDSANSFHGKKQPQLSKQYSLCEDFCLRILASSRQDSIGLNSYWDEENSKHSGPFCVSFIPLVLLSFFALSLFIAIYMHDLSFTLCSKFFSFSVIPFSYSNFLSHTLPHWFFLHQLHCYNLQNQGLQGRLCYPKWFNEVCIVKK